MAISTHLNAMIVMGVKSVYRFNRSSLSLGIDMTHFSNCAFNIPNYGINMPWACFMSYARSLRQDSISSVRKQIMQYKRLTVLMEYSHYRRLTHMVPENTQYLQ